MIEVIGFDEKVKQRFTCRNYGAIVQYAPIDDKFTDRTDEGCKIRGLNCPNCGEFHRTNP